MILSQAYVPLDGGHVGSDGWTVADARLRMPSLTLILFVTTRRVLAA